MPVVLGTALDVQLPEQCACCLAPSSRIRVAGKTTANPHVTTVATLVVPYCDLCSDHIRDHQRSNPRFNLGGATIVFVFLALAVWYGGSFVLERLPRRDTPVPPAEAVRNILLVLAALSAPFVGAGAFAAWGLMRRRPAEPTSPHSRGLPAVEVQRFDQGRVVLAIYNQEYARRIIAANPSAQLLEGQALGTPGSRTEHA